MTTNLQRDTVVGVPNSGHSASLLSTRIPPELIAEIIFHCASQCWSTFGVHFDESSESGSGKDSDSYVAPIPPVDAWIQPLHVCRRWREVALSSPRLWGHVILNYPAMAKECVTRSRDAPLHVWRFGTGVFSTEEQDAFALVIRQLSRVQELHIKASELAMPSLPEEVLNHISAPLLKICVFSGAQYPTLLDFMLIHDLPSLEHLEIPTGYSSAWSMLPLPPSLKSLKVSDSFRDRSLYQARGSRAPWPQGNSTNLETLYILDRSSASNSFSPITFHRLQSLKIGTLGDDRLLQYLLSFDLPPGANIRIHTFACPPIKQILDLCRCPPLRSVSVTVIADFNRHEFKFYAWFETHPVARLKDGTTLATFRLNCAEASTRLDRPKNLTLVFKDVETLSLSSLFKAGTRSFKIISKHVSNVRNLGLDGISAGTLLIGEAEEGGSIWDSFPKLQCLTLRGCGWNLNLLDIMLGCLQEKVETGVKLPRLEINCSILEGANFERLKDLVGEVYVADGSDDLF